MSISATELVNLLEQTTLGAFPKEIKRVETIIDTIKAGAIAARLDSPASLHLQEIADAGTELLVPDRVAQLGNIDLYCVELDWCEALARIHNDRQQVIVFSGLLNLTRFYANLINVLNLMQGSRQSETVLVNGSQEPETISFSSAAFALAIRHIEFGGELPDIGSLLGPGVKQNADIGYLGAIVFLLAHEMGHLSLGHTAKSPRSERVIMSLCLDEEINTYQAREFEADEFAFHSLREEIRNYFISSVMFFFGPFAFMETFAVERNRDHPLTSNRLARIAESVSFPGDPEAENAAKDVMQAEIDRFNKLALLREGYKGNARERIYENMPVSVAHAVMSQVIQKITREGSLLDMPS